MFEHANYCIWLHFSNHLMLRGRKNHLIHAFLFCWKRELSPQCWKWQRYLNCLLASSTIFIPGEIEIIAIGPLTNLALASKLDKDFIKKWENFPIEEKLRTRYFFWANIIQHSGRAHTSKQRDHGFDSRWELDFFSSSILNNVSLNRSLEEVQHCCFYSIMKAL